MISKEEYERVFSKWEGKVYQKWKKIKKRFPMLIDNESFFRNTNILEVGSNAGMYAVCLRDYFNKYTGTEADLHYHKQAKVTVREFDIYNVNLRNCTFENLDLDMVDFNLFIASYVIHHLNSRELDKLNIVFKRCNKVAIFTRSGDPSSYGHDETGHQPFSKWNLSEINQMLKGYNFVSELHLRKPKTYDGTYLILAEKK